MMNGTAIEQAVIKRNRTATLNRSQTSAPADTFKTKDGWVLVQSVGGPLFKRWADLMGEDHWLEDERFKDDISRGDNGEAISERLGAWCAERTSQEVLEAMEKARLPAGPVLSPQQVLDDPHIAAKGLFQPVEYPGLDIPAPLMKTPVELSETPGEIRTRPPTLGEHTDQLMEELGYSAGEISDLREKRVV
jgi:crotonobetainyl-CoA:carnitine CoA-transferase CaiB-like acyl-CoA transferase